MDPNSQYPEFNRKTDRVLVTLMLCTFLMPLMYALPSYYMFDWMTYIWIPVSALLSVGVYFLGRGVQRFWAKKIGFPKPEFDPDKSTRDYIRLKKTLLPLLAALAVGVALFFFSYGVRQLNYALTPHETEIRAKGHVYEVVAGIYGMAATYFSALLWFIPDDLILPADVVILRFIPPLAILLIPTIFFSIPIWIAAIYTALYLILLLIREGTLRSYRKACRQFERDEAYHRHQGRFDD